MKTSHLFSHVAITVVFRSSADHFSFTVLIYIHFISPNNGPSAEWT